MGTKGVLGSRTWCGGLVTLTQDGSGRLTGITDPDSAAWAYAYDSSNRITTLTNPRNYVTTAAYNFAGRVSTVTRPDNNTDQVSALQMQGLLQNYSTPVVGVVQSAIATSNTISFAPTTAGDLLIAVWVGRGGGGNTFAPPTTPSGWTLRKSISDSNKGVYVYEKANASSISSLTFSGESTDGEGIYFLEDAGAASSPFDVSASKSGTSASPDSRTTATTGTANELDIAALDMTKNGSTQISAFTSPTNGFTLDLQQATQYVADGPVYEDLRLAGLYKNVTATGTQNTGVSATSNPWQGAIVTYKQSGSVNVPVGSAPNNPASAVLAVQAQSTYTDPRSQAWPTTLDWAGFGLPIQVQDPYGNTSNIYRDANGLPWLNEDALGNRTRSFFDTSGNQTKLVQQDNSTKLWSYNSFGEVTQTTDEAGNINTMTYDSNGNLTQTKDALSDITTFTYNSQGFQTSQKDPLGNVTSMGYDSRNRQTTQTDALGKVVTMGYDSASNMTTRQDQRANVTTFSYDGMGRTLTQALPDSNPSNHPVVTMAYEPKLVTSPSASFTAMTRFS